MELIINRKTWSRGDPETSMLYNSDTGLRCCVGFYCEAIGIPRVRITNRPSVENLFYSCNRLDLPSGQEWLNSSMDVKSLYSVNDSIGGVYSEADREAEIARLFAKHGVSVRFIN